MIDKQKFRIRGVISYDRTLVWVWDGDRILVRTNFGIHELGIDRGIGTGNKLTLVYVIGGTRVRWIKAF
jgi:hypothetical protein